MGFEVLPVASFLRVVAPILRRKVGGVNPSREVSFAPPPFPHRAGVRGGVPVRGLPAGDRLSRLRKGRRGLVPAFGRPAQRSCPEKRRKAGPASSSPAGEPPDRNAVGQGRGRGRAYPSSPGGSTSQRASRSTVRAKRPPSACRRFHSSRV